MVGRILCFVYVVIDTELQWTQREVGVRVGDIFR